MAEKARLAGNAAAFCRGTLRSFCRGFRRFGSGARLCSENPRRVLPSCAASAAAVRQPPIQSSGVNSVRATRGISGERRGASPLDEKRWRESSAPCRAARSKKAAPPAVNRTTKVRNWRAASSSRLAGNCPSRRLFSIFRLVGFFGALALVRHLLTIQNSIQYRERDAPERSKTAGYTDSTPARKARAVSILIEKESDRSCSCACSRPSTANASPTGPAGQAPGERVASRWRRWLSPSEPSPVSRARRAGTRGSAPIVDSSPEQQHLAIEAESKEEQYPPGAGP